MDFNVVICSSMDLMFSEQQSKESKTVFAVSLFFFLFLVTKVATPGILVRLVGNQLHMEEPEMIPFSRYVINCFHGTPAKPKLPGQNTEHCEQTVDASLGFQKCWITWRFLFNSCII